MKKISLISTTFILLSACGSSSISSTLSSSISETTSTISQDSSEVLLSSAVMMYRVQFDSRGGNGTSDQWVEPSSFLVEPNVNREGHSLVGWFQSNDEGTTLTSKWNFTSDRVTSDLLLYADWTVLSYSLTFDTQGGTPFEPLVLEYGSLIDFPQPTKEGFVFLGWSVHSSLSEGYPSLTAMPGEHLTLYAQWVSNVILDEFGLPGNGFGDVVRFDGDYIVIGSPNTDLNGQDDQGSVNVFKLSDPSFQRMITASDGQAYDYFGSSIGLDGDYLIVGAPYHDQRASDAGVVYVYKLSDLTYERKVQPLDLIEGDTFGWGISADNGLFVVGSNLSDDIARDAGSFYVFSCEDETFEEKMVPPLGQIDDWFGWGSALDGDLIAVGSVHDDDQGGNSGSVFLYESQTLSLLETLTPPENSPNANFGTSISITKDHIFVGAPGTATPLIEAGVVYVFDRITRQLLHTIHSPSSASGNSFGHTVASDGTFLMVSEHSTNRDNMENVGTVWCFDIASWSVVEKMDSPVEAAHENFSFSWDGRSIAIELGIVVVGSSANDDLGIDAGKAYIYSFGNRGFIPQN
jgi:uncharacterized repeat protein (TIGR02543 family)